MVDRVALADALGALLELPARLDRMEQQQARIFAAVEAMGGAGALGPVDLAAAAPVLKKSVATLRRLAKRGELPGAVRVGRSWKIRLGDVRAPADEVGRLAAEARQ